MTGSGMSSVN